MKHLSTLLTLLLAVCALQAQQLSFAKGTYGIDTNKKIIVATGNQAAKAEQVRVGQEMFILYRTTMPVINITTDGPIVNTPAVHGIVSVADAQGNVIEMDAGFKIRGTSSQLYDKKSYRMELWADETGLLMADTTFLGLRSDDDWNLEAMWTQPLRLRNKVANQLWMEMYQLPYQSSEPDALPGIRMEYADLFVNGEYVGIYALTERMDRKQLGLRKYNGNLRGVLYKGNGAGAPTFESLPDFDNASDTWDNYEWVYPNESDTAIDWENLYGFTNFVMNASDNAFYSQYSLQADVDNLVDYYLFVNVLKAMDNMGRNVFLARYKKSSTYFYLPWDLDAILGLDTDGHQGVGTAGLMGNGLYDRLLNDCQPDGFVEKAQLRYNALRNDVLTRDHIAAMFRNQYELLDEEGAYEREHEAWPDFVADASQLDYLSDWLDARLQYLDTELNAGCGTWGREEPSAQALVEVFPNPAHGLVNLRFSESCAKYVSFYDMTGRRVYSKYTDSQQLVVNTGTFPKGVYAILVSTTEGNYVERLLLQ